MKQLLLASALIVTPVSGFTVVELLLPGAPAAATSSESGGDLAAAESRITGFETAWDDGEATTGDLAGRNVRARLPRDALGDVQAP